ncbi:hypothetical protein ACH5RR_005859 [Cinchona calisaya]|uniref:Pentatricopeptide repeat-containing protein n=1 Tax=Cinchona calisaya TaxID=153742 RepID=A0ABD3AMP9_9GENT
MIRGYVQSHLAVPSILCYKSMLNDGFIANNYTFTPLIKACSVVSREFKQMGFVVHFHVEKLCLVHDPFIVSSLIEFYSVILDMGNARNLFDEMPQRDVVLCTAMIDGYGKLGDVGEARELFEQMSERNVISWSAIMAAYSRVSDFKEVLLLYRRMEEAGVKPNESVLVSVLTACGHLGALSQGLWIHSYAKRCGFEASKILATALVDMYSKCGWVEMAFSVFEGIVNKDSGAWNAIIYGFAMNGYATKSLELFDQMVEPRLEHYACVVDLLARAGKLEDAEKFIEEKMGGIGKGDAAVWGALLGACRLYGNTEMGDRIWRKLAKMGVKDYGTHILSYNIYREAGRESEARRVRRLIEDTGMKKKPGCSVVEVNGLIEEFLAGDLLHPKSQEVSQMLDSLFNVMYLAQSC